MAARPWSGKRRSGAPKASFVRSSRKPNSYSKRLDQQKQESTDDRHAANRPDRPAKTAGNEPFIEGLAVIEREAGDARNFVRKAVNMALRAIGKRNRALNVAAVAVARRLEDSNDATARWVGKDALREPASPAVSRRLDTV
ncbi:MAG: DNA alkylation repair protein [Betaproteobacteria bacterium]